MKRITITIAVVILTIIACKKKSGQYCWNQAIYNGTVVYEWDNNTPPSNKVQKYEDSCHCKTTTSVKCIPCENATDINGNSFNCN